jgi:hypothetical protein
MGGPEITYQGGLPTTIVRSYKAKRQSDAVLLFMKDASKLDDRGYTPSSQSWAPGQYSGRDFLFALLLCFLLVGVFVFVYMLLVKPEGSLTVTFVLRSAAPVTPTETPSSIDMANRIGALAALRDRGIVTDAEFETKKAELLGRI